MKGSKQDRKRLLVIDDDEAIRRLLTRELSRAGFRVSTADDGADAIECMKRSLYDVIILDLAMPRVDGFAVLHHLRESDPYLLRRVIVLTGQDPEVVNGDPIFAVVRKPFVIDRMIAAVLQCCEKSSQGSPEVAHPTPERHPLTRIMQRLLGREEEPERVRDVS
jgi:DNA-binding response OmpR family regulator